MPRVVFSWLNSPELFSDISPNSPKINVVGIIANYVIDDVIKTTGSSISGHSHVNILTMLVKISAYLCILAGGVLSGSPHQETCGIQSASNDFSAGKNASLDEFPWVALLSYDKRTNNDAEFKCLGSLISPRHVLTVANCVVQREMIIPKSVRLGEYDLTTDPDCVKQHDIDCADAPQNIEIEKIVVHEDYDMKTADNNIALIKLMGDAVFTDFVRPICLPSPKLDANPGDQVLLSGWGRHVPGEEWTIKKKIVSSIIANEDCKKDYNDSKRIILENFLCTKAFKNNTAFACLGDSGGPVMLLKDDRWYQAGIISFGRGCGYEIPDVNIKVENYLDWIKEKINTM